MKNYSIRKATRLGLEVFILTVTQDGQVVHESSHMSKAGVITRLLQYRSKGV